MNRKTPKLPGEIQNAIDILAESLLPKRIQVDKLTVPVVLPDAERHRLLNEIRKKITVHSLDSDHSLLRFRLDADSQVDVFDGVVNTVSHYVHELLF